MCRRPSLTTSKDEVGDVRPLRVDHDLGVGVGLLGIETSKRTREGGSLSWKPKRGGMEEGV